MSPILTYPTCIWNPHLVHDLVRISLKSLVSETSVPGLLCGIVCMMLFSLFSRTSTCDRRM